MKRIVLLVFLFLVVSLPNCLAIEGDTTKEETYENTVEDIESNEVFNITFSPNIILSEQQITFFMTIKDETTDDDKDDDGLMDDLIKPLKFFTRTISYEF